LIEMHGGELIVQSKLNAGTTMTIRLPRSRVVVAPIPARAAAS
jgi:signal transduction histidine kinase